MHEIVERFVTELPERIQTLREAWESGADGPLLRASEELQSHGERSGFGEISERAAALESSIQRAIEEKADRQSSEIRVRFEELIGLCRRATFVEEE